MAEEQTAVTRDSRGRFVTGNKLGAPPITPDTARSMVQKRIDKFRQAGARGAKKAALAIDPTVETVFDAHAILVERAYTEALDNPKEGILDWLSQSYGAKPMPHERTAEAASVTVNIGKVDAIAVLLAGMDTTRADVVDAEVTDADGEVGGGGGSGG